MTISPAAKLSLAFVLFSATHFSVLAWDSPGHMAVAGAAYDSLTTDEQKRLVAILSQHRDVDRFKTDLHETKLKPRDLVMAAATWPDLIKQDTTNYTDKGYNETGPITAVTDDHLMHKGWHFINMPLSRDGTTSSLPVPDDNTVDAVTVLKVLETQLASNESDQQKAFDLCWLLHLVGDLHQPLHCVVGVDHLYTAGDDGANYIHVSGETHSAENLHAYWDDVLGKTAGAKKLKKDVLTADKIITNLANVSLPADCDKLDPAEWVTNCMALAKSDAYNFGSGNVSPTSAYGKDIKEDVTLTTDYYTQTTNDAQIQIKTAGYRLAKLLKPIVDQ